MEQEQKRKQRMKVERQLSGGCTLKDVVLQQSGTNEVKCLQPLNKAHRVNQSVEGETEKLAGAPPGEQLGPLCNNERSSAAYTHT